MMIPLMTRMKLSLLEEKVKKVQVGEEDLTELLHIVGHHTTPRAKVIILMKNCDYIFFTFLPFKVEKLAHKFLWTFKKNPPKYYLQV